MSRAEKHPVMSPQLGLHTVLCLLLPECTCGRHRHMDHSSRETLTDGPGESLHVRSAEQSALQSGVLANLAQITEEGLTLRRGRKMAGCAQVMQLHTVLELWVWVGSMRQETLSLESQKVLGAAGAHLLPSVPIWEH